MDVNRIAARLARKGIAVCLPILAISWSYQAHAGVVTFPIVGEVRGGPATRVPLAPEINAQAFWVESAVCTLVLKTSIDIARPILSGTPIDQFSTLPATCALGTGAPVNWQGGVRALLGIGFRVKSVSHSVTNLGVVSDGKVELLLSAVFALERPDGSNPAMTR